MPSSPPLGTLERTLGTATGEGPQRPSNQATSSRGRVPGSCPPGPGRQDSVSTEKMAFRLDEDIYKMHSQYWI